MNKFTVRGIIYIVISLIGLSYEFFFAASIRTLPVVVYSFVILIGLICIFKK
jgi:hypothetical protein